MNSSLRQFLMIFVFLLLSHTCCDFGVPYTYGQGSEIRFEHPFNLGLSIFEMAQDNDGFIWLGTSGGVFRFDGYEIKEYLAGKGVLSTNYSPNVFVDSEGLIWIGTVGGGLNLYDKMTDTFTSFRNNPGNPNTISSDSFNWKPGMIAEDKEGLLWLATQNGLNSFDKKTMKFKRFMHNPGDENSLSDNYVWGVCVDRDGLVWAGTKDGGLNSYDKSQKRFKNYRHDPENEYSLSNDWVYGITEDHEGILWIGTKEGGLNRFDKKTDVFTQYWHDPDDPYSLAHDEVAHIEEDRFGDLWLSRSYSTAKGVEKFDRKTGRFFHYRHQPGNADSISGNIITQAFEDRSGTMWFIENNGGVEKYDRRSSQFRNYRHIEENDGSLSTNTITTLFEDKSGDVWAGTFLGGVNRYNPITESFTAYKYDPEDIDSLFHNYAFSVFEDSEGLFWIGTDDGILNIFDRKTGKVVKRYTNDYSNQAARSLMQDSRRKNFLWFGTESDGLFRFNKKNGLFSQYKNDPEDPLSISSNSVYHIVQDTKNELWIATLGGGLNRYDYESDSFKVYRADPLDPSSISSDIVNGCHIDKKGKIWLGTDDGVLNCFDPETGLFTYYYIKKKFPISSITTILEDDMGFFWLGSNLGLLKFNPETGKVEKIYTESDGLCSNKVSLYATSACKTKDGRMWFATGTKGLITFYPDRLLDNTYVPPVVLTSFKQGHKKIEFGKAVEKVTDVQLSWLYNFFEFEFSALNYTLTEKNQYKYMLEGFDKEWFYSGTRRFGRYSGLPGGNYTLKIKGSNNDGVWNENGYSVRISVTPPIWKTWWAYSIYLTVFLGAVLFFIGNQRRKLLQERLLNDRLRKIDKVKDEFLANTSHELKTPLNGIIGIAESLIDGVAGQLGAKAKNNLGMIALSGRRLTGLVNDILDYSRLKHKDIQLHLQTIDLRVLSEVVVTISQPIIMKKNLQLVNRIPENISPVEADENRVQQILHNLVGNAAKFTEKGMIILSAKEQGGYLEISVSDTGIGVHEDYHGNIFKSFEQADGSASRVHGGTGLGLAVSKKLVEMHGGELNLESTEGEGARFYFTLPLASGHSDPKVISYKGPQPRSPQMDFVFDKAEKIGASKVVKERKHILIVDDEPINLLVLENYLGLENFNVTKVSDGLAALGLIENMTWAEPEFDIVLLDVMMPKISGYEVCRKIRQKFPPDILPVIMLTAKGMVKDLVAGFDAGANDYLAKPFIKEELLARIRSQLPLKELVKEREKAKKDLENLNIELENRVELRTNQLEEANTELKESIESLSEAQNHLVQSEKMAALGALVAGITHEISTPIGICVTASSFLDMKTGLIVSKLESGPLKDTDMKKYFRSASEASSIIMANLNRAADLIQSFKRVSVDQSSEDLRHFNLLSYINEILTSLGPKLAPMKPVISVDCPDNIELRSYPGAYAQIITNLVLNSAVHGFQDKKTGEGFIHIGVIVEEGRLHIHFSDNGKGMDGLVQKRLFDPFFTTKRGAEGGTGLGMHIVYNIVTQKLKGQIECDSTTGKGVVFTIKAPLNIEASNEKNSNVSTFGAMPIN